MYTNKQNKRYAISPAVKRWITFAAIIILLPTPLSLLLLLLLLLVAVLFSLAAFNVAVNDGVGDFVDDALSVLFAPHPTPPRH